MKLEVYNQKGEKVGDQELNAKIFEVPVNTDVISQVIVAQQANSRAPYAHTKQRKEMRGGGRKPWRQKGTGRARHGSIRSPLWRGGAITFGPTKMKNFSKKVNKKMKRKALFMVLSDKAINKSIVLVDNLDVPEIKTKTCQDMKKAILKAASNKTGAGNEEKQENNTVNKEKKQKVLFVTTNKNLILSARNLPRTNTTSANSLNVVDLLTYEHVIMPVDALKVIEEVYLKD